MHCKIFAILVFLGLIGIAPALAAASGIFSVRDGGAVGDGKALDTASIQKSIDACAAAGGGRVVFPPGTYLSGTLHLKSNIELHLEAGATLLGSPDLAHYDIFLDPNPPQDGKPYGNWHRSLVMGSGVENIAVTGPGTINGNRVFDPHGEEKMRGPHAVLLGGCRGVRFQDLTLLDASNYAIMMMFCDRAEVRACRFIGGWDGVHFRGLADRYGRGLVISRCDFKTGDDSIAGRYVEDLLVEDCRINSSCNGVRIIGPMRRMTLRNCTFTGPGVEPHRTSARHNMLSGIILQPGAWDPCPGALEDVTISSVTMANVATPVTLYMKVPGNSAARITVERLTATGVYRAPLSVESWIDTPIGTVTFRDANIEYVGGGTAEQARMEVKPPATDSRPLPAWGVWANSAARLVLENVTLTCQTSDARPAIKVEPGVKEMVLKGLSLGSAGKIDDPRHTSLKDLVDIPASTRVQYEP